MLEDISLFCGATDTPGLASGEISFRFQNQSGQPYSLLVQVYVIYIPLVRHLPTS